jgi:sugar phosphate permease
LLSFVIGLAQGPAWPCCAKVLQNWLPKNQFGTWWGVVSTSANVAGAIGPLIATSIALKYHWSYGFMIPGCIAMSVGYLCIIVLRNKPSDVGFDDFNIEKSLINDTDGNNNDNEVDDTEYDKISEENESKQANCDESEGGDEDDISWSNKAKQIMKYPYFVSICLAYFIVQLIKTIFSDWSQIYLIRSIKIDPYLASYFMFVLEVSGIVGSILSGILTDLCYKVLAKQYEKSSEEEAKKLIENKNVNGSNRKPPSIILVRMAFFRIYLIGLILSLHIFINYIRINTSFNFMIVNAALIGNLNLNFNFSFSFNFNSFFC